MNLFSITKDNSLELRNQAFLVIVWITNALLFTWFLSYVFGEIESSQYLFNEEGRPIGGDFLVFWSSGLLFVEGHLYDLFDPAAFRTLLAEFFDRDVPEYSWVHPPQMLFFVLPLSQLPYLWSLAIWSLLTLLAYTIATRRLALLFAPSTFINLNIGQTGFLLGAMYFGAIRLLERHPVLAGICIGLIAVKPHLGVLIPVALLAVRAWSTIVSAALTIGTLVILSGLAFGWEAWRLWLFEAIPHQSAFLQEELGGTITPSAFAGARLLGLPAWGAWFAQAPFTILGTVATWWAFSRWRQELIPATTAFAILLLSTALATPYIFHYDLTLVSPVALQALTAWRQRTRRLTDVGELVLWLLVWILPFLVVRLNALGLPISSVILLAALAATVWRAAGTKVSREVLHHRNEAARAHAGEGYDLSHDTENAPHAGS